jgi:uroporphyrinogen decarboxylase
MSITPIRPKWAGTLTDRERFVRQMHYAPVNRCFYYLDRKEQIFGLQ